MHIIETHEIDWNTVNTVEDIKNVLIGLGIKFDVNEMQGGQIEALRPHLKELDNPKNKISDLIR